MGEAGLVNCLQTFTQFEPIKLPMLPEADALSRELLKYETKVGQNANDI